VRSRLYTGMVAHERPLPVVNRFHYPIYYVGLDLDELDEVDSAVRRFSHNSANLVSVWDRDHGPRDGTPLRPWIDALAASAGIDLTGGRVMLVTFPRVLGTRFFPVSFWYLFGADGEARGVLMEVHNTFRERHNYLLHNHGDRFEWSSRPTAIKAFYVSPFIPREDVTYEFAFSDPAETLSVTVRDFVGGTLTLTASINVTAEPLTDGALVRTVLRHGPISAVAIMRILWQAAKLTVKGVRFYQHTEAPDEVNSL